MTQSDFSKTCSHCQSTTLTFGTQISLSAETGWIGLKHKDGRLLIGTEPLLADVCAACGHIEHLTAVPVGIE